MRMFWQRIYKTFIVEFHRPTPSEFSTRNAVSNVQMPSQPLSAITDYGKQSQLARVVLNVFFRQHGFSNSTFMSVKQFSSSQEKC